MKICLHYQLFFIACSLAILIGASSSSQHSDDNSHSNSNSNGSESSSMEELEERMTKFSIKQQNAKRLFHSFESSDNHCNLEGMLEFLLENYMIIVPEMGEIKTKALRGLLKNCLAKSLDPSPDPLSTKLWQYTKMASRTLDRYKRFIYLANNNTELLNMSMDTEEWKSIANYLKVLREALWQQAFIIGALYIIRDSKELSKIFLSVENRSFELSLNIIVNELSKKLDYMGNKLNPHYHVLNRAITELEFEKTTESKLKEALKQLKAENLVHLALGNINEESDEQSSWGINGLDED